MQYKVKVSFVNGDGRSIENICGHKSKTMWYGAK